MILITTIGVFPQEYTALRGLIIGRAIMILSIGDITADSDMIRFTGAEAGASPSVLAGVGIPDLAGAILITPMLLITHLTGEDTGAATIGAGIPGDMIVLSVMLITNL